MDHVFRDRNVPVYVFMLDFVCMKSSVCRQLEKCYRDRLRVKSSAEMERSSEPPPSAQAEMHKLSYEGFFILTRA